MKKRSGEVLATIVKEKSKVENSIEREGAIKKNVENIEAVIEHVAELVEANTPLPEDSNFASYEEWENFLQKRLKAYNSSLETIAKQKNLLTAYDYYITNNLAL